MACSASVDPALADSEAATGSALQDVTGCLSDLGSDLDSWDLGSLSPISSCDVIADCL